MSKKPVKSHNYAKWDEIIENDKNNLNYHGLSVSVCKDGKNLYRKGFGYRDFENKLPMDENTIFGIGSITKSFTALAIMQLVERGKVNLEDPVDKYIDFRLGMKEFPIKIKHLLSHSSGIPELNITIGTIFQKIGISLNVELPSSYQDTLNEINQAQGEVLFSPEKVFMYNNEMFMILSGVIESASGMKYEQFVKQNILDPLGMSTTKFSSEVDQEEQNLTKGYHLSEDGNTLIPKIPIVGENSHALGGLFSTILDMELYIQLFFNKGFAGNRQIISQKSIEQMWNPFISIHRDDAENANYGFGWFIVKDFLDRKLVYHGGDILTTGGLCLFVPEEQIGIIFGVNGAGNPAVLDLAKKIIADLLDEDVNRALPGLQEKNMLRKLMGHYRTYRGIFELDVSVLSGVPVLISSYPGLKEPFYFPLAVENLQKLKFFVPTALSGPKDRAQFFIESESGNIYLKFKEYRFNKD